MAAGAIEFELKFTGAPDRVAALPDSAFFAAIAPAGGAWERLSSTYYDTPDRALAAAGLSLRLREEGAALIQAVKSKGENPAARTEFETALGAPREFPASTGDRDTDKLIESLKDELRPIAETIVDRWTAVIHFKAAEIELAVDIGQVRRVSATGAISAPMAEVEIELLSTDKPKSRAAMFDFARLLAANTPGLRLSPETKLETAMALGAGKTRLPRARRVRLSPDLAGADLLGAALVSCAARLAALQPYVTELRAPEGIHQTRVELRRLRALERVFRRYLRDPQLSDLAREARALGRRFAPARDWDVFLLETVPSARASGYRDQDLRAVKARAEAIRAAHWSDAASVIGGPDYTRFLLDLAETGATRAWARDSEKALRGPVSDLAPKILDRALHKVIRVAAMAQGAPAPAARHPLRIALKKLRYPVQLFRDLYPRDERREYMAAMSALQDAFGALNDAVVAQRLADEAASGGGEAVMRAAGFIAGYKAAEAKEAAKKIDAAWIAFEKMRPFWRK